MRKLFLAAALLLASYAFAQNEKVSAMGPATMPLSGLELVPIVQSGQNVTIPVADLIGGLFAPCGPYELVGNPTGSPLVPFCTGTLEISAIVVPQNGTATRTGNGIIDANYIDSVSVVSGIPFSLITEIPYPSILCNCNPAANPGPIQASATLPTALIPVFTGGDVTSSGGTAVLNVSTVQGHSVPFTLAQWGVPVILSSGTVSTTPSASGGFTPSTTWSANPCVNGCYIYVMANAITASSAAGDYFATCSSVSNCSLFNNTLALGSLPSVVGSPTSFGTVAGGTSTITTATDFGLVSFKLAANTLGTNGSLAFTGDGWRNSSANTVYEKLWVGTSAGTMTNVMAEMSSTSVQWYGMCRTFRLLGAANALATFPVTVAGVCDQISQNTTPNIMTNNFAADQYITISGQLATASTDYLQVVGGTFIVTYAP